MKKTGLLLLVVLMSFSAFAETNHSRSSYGRELSELGQLGIGSCTDVVRAGKMLYVIGKGNLYAVDVAQATKPKLIATLPGLGHVRQICVAGNTAYVTAREDGLFVIDVAQSNKPKLIAHYDTIELATGIAVSGDVLFVACRTAGVELVDISDPGHPQHLSTVRTGEAQSVVARNGVLYAGVWAAKKLVVCDVSKPRAPRIVAEAPLDGYGDGVDVRGKYCYVATGHHARGTPRSDTSAPGYGGGHGLEIFDVSDPAKPEFVSRVKLPRLYRMGMDLWGVVASDRYAYVADTHNGVFVVDVADPAHPQVVAHHRLPLDKRRNDPSPVGGVAVGDGVLYAAGVWSDLHVIKAPMAKPVVPEPDKAPAVPTIGKPKPDPRLTAYQPGGQVHAVAFDGDIAMVACGNAGLHALEMKTGMRKLADYPTDGFALGVAVCNRRVFVAEGNGGLSIWQHQGKGKLLPLGRYNVGNESIRQVVVPPPGNYALLHVGQGKLHILDVRNPRRPECVLKDSHHGLFYYSPITQTLFEDRYAICHWHVDGLFRYDLSGKLPRLDEWRYPTRIGSPNGAAFINGQQLIICRNGYVLLKGNDTRPPDKLTVQRIDGVKLTGKPTIGKPTIDGDTLFASHRNGGMVYAVDIADPTKPRLIDTLKLAGHPGLAVIHRGRPVIPGGNQGLLVWKLDKKR